MFKTKDLIEFEVVREALEQYRKLLPKDSVGFQASTEMIKRIDNYRIEDDQY